jgi:RNAse (barnase) inhibitor barstar
MMHADSIRYGRMFERWKIALQFQHVKNYDELWDVVNGIIAQSEEDLKEAELASIWKKLKNLED